MICGVAFIDTREGERLEKFHIAAEQKTSNQPTGAINNIALFQFLAALAKIIRDNQQNNREQEQWTRLCNPVCMFLAQNLRVGW
jgi:hypothetical protein